MRLRQLLLAISVLVLASQGLAQGCERWNTSWFFESATVEMVESCLAAGAEVSARTEYGYTPLHYVATWNDNPSIIRALVAAGADVNVRTEGGDTPLHLAVTPNYNASLAIIEALLDAGAEVNARGEGDDTPLHHAALRENPAIIRALVAAGADVNARTEGGDTPLHYAAEYSDNPAIIEILLDAGANASVRDRHGRIPWDYARDRSELEGSDAYQRLRTLTLKQECVRWNTPEFFRSASLARVVDCLEAGRDVNARVLGRTPLHWAVTYDADLRVIEALVEAGADVNARTENGHTPLHFAPNEYIPSRPLMEPGHQPRSQWYYTAVIKLLVDAGADVNARADNGETPLHWAAFASDDNAASILVLVDAGADPSARDEDGNTPLYKASLENNLASILVLVAAGADVNAQDPRGETPLHWAARGRG